MTQRIEIDADPRQKITVKLVGEEYLITPPKAVLALKIARASRDAKDDTLAQMEVLDDWLLAAFGKANYNKVQKRLENNTDPLDFPHLMKLMQGIIELQMGVSGNPTG